MRAVMGLACTALLTAMVGVVSAAAAPIALGIKSAAMQIDEFTGRPTVAVELEAGAQRSFAKLTTRHVGQVIDLLVDGKVVSSPVVQMPIVGPSLTISGNFTISEAAALAQRLSNGEARVAVDLAAD